jgi:ribonuclease P/MRP protein subunit POP8
MAGDGVEGAMDIDVLQNPTSKSKSRPSRGHEITTKTIKSTPFSYIHLELISSLPSTSTTSSTYPSKPTLDALTIRTYLTSALAQFLGLTGSAISIDILKISGLGCWIRVAREDLSPVLAAVGGWVGNANGGGGADGSERERVGWRVKGSGNWLSVLLAQRDEESIWND